MSQELLVLKREIWNGEGKLWGSPRGRAGVESAASEHDLICGDAVSISARECEEGQRQGWSNAEQSINNAKQRIDSANRNVQAGNEKLKKLAEGGAL
uniref:Mast cell expressed membrane protein 1 n=1 Tax=Pipistrellus kuhlii TaxID=59472 RepID=A0A7J7UA86_PIPKU|nr:mast cell expressed membrane protein 1 [Pipistrellus kuhlii]